MTTGFPATGYYRGTWGASAPHSGSYAYSISNLAYGGIDSNFISVKPSTPYTLQAYLKGELDPDDSAPAPAQRVPGEAGVGARMAGNCASCTTTRAILI